MESWARTWETEKSRKRTTRVRTLGPGTEARSAVFLQFWVLDLNSVVHLAFFCEFLYPAIAQLAYRVRKSVTGETFFFFKPEKL